MSGLNLPAEACIENGAACLHLLMSASTDTLRACLSHTGSGDSILLLDQAVSLLLDQSWSKELPAGIRVFAGRADVQARAISGLAEPIQLVDDQTWVELVSCYPHCLSWK